jgi:hypothetical protein
MTKLADVLLRCGARLPVAESEDLLQREPRSLFDDAAVGVETDADGSKRLRWHEKHSQLVLTPYSELVVVHSGFEREASSTVENVVCARTPEKAANELTKLRLWRAAEGGLRHIGAIGKPERPPDLADWKLQNTELAERLQRQLDAIGLAAEKTHQFSSQVFEPALLATLEPRIASFRKAVAYFFVAEVTRSRVVAETRKRLLRKTYSDSEARGAYLAARAELDSRAADLYRKASALVR